MTMQDLNDRGEAPLLSILIVNYNGLRHLEECLSSLRDQNFRDFETVLVDNASKDASPDYVREKFPEVRIVNSGSNLGFSGGNNFGLRHCRGRYVFFLNNDTRMEPGALSALAAGIRAYPGYRAFACFMLNYRNPAVTDNAGETLYRIGLVSNLGGYPAALFTTPREVIGACGGAAVYARSLLDQIGGFDEDFFLIYEDMDLSLRARHNGDRILFLPDVRILHKGSASIGGSFSSVAAYYYTRNYPLMMIQNLPAATLVKCLPGNLPGFAYRFLLALRYGVWRDYLRGIRDAVRMLPSAIRKRRRVLGASRIDREEFERLMRPGWLRDRLIQRRGGVGFVP